MMFKSDILFGKDSRQALLAGAKKMSDAVSSTIGPSGRNVAIAKVNPQGDIYERVILHDGVSVARSIELADPFENMGAQIIKQAAQKTVDTVGDGTSVSTLLAYCLLEEINTLTAAGIDPMKLRRKIEEAIKELIKEIEKLAIPVKSFDQLKHIATISAEDKVLGEMIAKVFEEMGKDGLVVVEESKSAETTVEKQKGMQIDKGYLNQWFITRPETNEAIFESPFILLTDKLLSTFEPIKGILEFCHKNQKPLIVIAPNFGINVIQAAVQNKITGAIPGMLIKAPSFGQDQKNKLHDIAIYTGGKFFTEDANLSLDEATIDDLGRCNYINANKTETIIVGGKGKKEVIELRIAEIKKAIEKEEIEFDRVKMKERLGRLTSGVAVIKVGGTTEVEMKERLERVKDAKEASKAALENGIVPGGEIIYLKIREKLKLKGKDFASDLLYRTLYKPFQKLLENADLNHGQWYERIQNAPENSGVDVTKEEMVDMVQAGIIDPALVPIQALRNASSVALQLATTGVTINQYLPKES